MSGSDSDVFYMGTPVAKNAVERVRTCLIRNRGFTEVAAAAFEGVNRGYCES